MGQTEEPGMFNQLVDLAKHPLFADLVLDELVLAAVEAYYARSIYLAAAQANRLEPVPPYEGSSYQWHHDMRRKYVKAMWLLTDVAPDGQRMTYIIGSHKFKHRGTSYNDSRFSDAEARSYGPALECAAQAGSVVIFDTNGLHRGNRNLGPQRDTLFGVYSVGRHLHGCRFDLDALPHLTGWQRSVLERSRHASKGYGQ